MPTYYFDVRLNRDLTLPVLAHTLDEAYDRIESMKAEQLVREACEDITRIDRIDYVESQSEPYEFAED